MATVICKTPVYVSSGSNNNNNNNNGRSSLGSCQCRAGLIAAYSGQGELILCSVARLEALIQDLELTLPPTEGRQTHLTNQFRLEGQCHVTFGIYMLLGRQILAQRKKANLQRLLQASVQYINYNSMFKIFQIIVIGF